MRKNVYPKSLGYWNRGRIKAAAKKFKYRYEWRKDKSYEAAKNFRVINDKEISGHLSNIRPTRRKWSNKESRENYTIHKDEKGRLSGEDCFPRLY